MSTPRHEPLMPPETIWLQIGEDEPGAENKSFSEFRDEVTWCWHKINDNDLEYRLVAEGVAAPLEPSNDLYVFCRKWLTKNRVNEIALDDVVRCAAAVSKNLTDKYAEMEAKWMRELLTVSNEIGEARASVEQLCGDLKAIQQDYTNEKKRADGLEKEITALTLSRKEDAEWINKKAQAKGCFEIVAYSAGMLLRGEIAALRETKP